MTKSLLPSLSGEERKGDDLFSVLHREVDRVFNEFQRDDRWPFATLSADNGKLKPRVNMSETDKAIELTAELPGVEEKDIDVTLSGDMVTIKGEKKAEREEKNKDYRLVERSHGSFERTMRLPCEVQDAKVKAEFMDGVLTVILPKTPEAKAKIRKIPVKTH